LDNLPWIRGCAANISAGQPGARMGLYDTEQQRVETAVGNGGVLEINMTSTGKFFKTWTIDPTDQPAVNALCPSIVATPAYLPQPPVSVAVTNGALQNKSDRLKALQKYMIARGVRRISIRQDPAGGGGNPLKPVKITVLPLAEMVRRTQAGLAVADNVVS